MNAAATRLVSLLPAATEIVAALGLADRLVGRSHECDEPASVATLPALTAPRIDPAGTSRQIHDAVGRALADTAGGAATSGRTGSSTGSVNEKRHPTMAPALYRFWAFIRPRCDSTMERHSDSPMPRPSALVEKKASYRRDNTSSGMPGPASVTLNSMAPPSSGVCRGTTRNSRCRREAGSWAASMASAAFFIRFISTCSMRIGSACSVGRRCAT